MDLVLFQVMFPDQKLIRPSWLAAMKEPSGVSRIRNTGSLCGMLVMLAGRMNATSFILRYESSISAYSSCM